MRGARAGLACALGVGVFNTRVASLIISNQAQGSIGVDGERAALGMRRAAPGFRGGNPLMLQKARAKR